MEQTTVTANAPVDGSRIRAIREFFGCQTNELKSLTKQDRDQLADGILSGTFTY